MEAIAPDPSAIDALDETALLVVEGLTDADDEYLGWCRRAPCVVAATVESDGSSPSQVDLVVRAQEVDGIAARVAANPSASRALVDVLRIAECVADGPGLVVESFAYSLLLAGPEFTAWLGAEQARPAKRFEGGPVHVERIEGRLSVTMARPENRNAFGAGMRDALWEALSILDVDGSIDHVVISGAGPVFCSGGDLTEFGTSVDLARAHQIRTLRSVGAVIARHASKIEVRMRGACVGAGLELSAFAGHVVAEEGTTVRLPEIGMGLIPGAGGTVSLTRRIGRQRTALLALSGEEVPVTDPLVAGLVDEFA